MPRETKYKTHRPTKPSLFYLVPLKTKPFSSLSLSLSKPFTNPVWFYSLSSDWSSEYISPPIDTSSVCTDTCYSESGFWRISDEMKEGLRSRGAVMEALKDDDSGLKPVNGVVTGNSLCDNNVVNGEKVNGLGVNNVSLVSKTVNGVVMDNSHSGVDNGDDNLIHGENKENGLDTVNVNSVLMTVNGEIMNGLNLGLGNGDDNVVDSDKKKGLDIDLNEVDNEKNELDSSTMVYVPVNDEVLSAHDGEPILVDGDVKKNELDLVSNVVDCVDESLDVLVDEKIEECECANVENVVISSGPKKKIEKVSKKKRKATSTAKVKIDVDSDLDLDAAIPEKKKGRPPKERRLESNFDVNGEVEVITSGPKKKIEKLSEKKRKLRSSLKEKFDVSADLDIETSVQKMKLRRPPKENRVESNVIANVETAIVTSGPRFMFGKIPKKKRRAMGNLKGKVDDNADSDIDTKSPQRKLGRPRKKRTEESDVEADLKTAAVTSESRIRSAKLPKKRGKKTSTLKGKVIVNADCDRHTIVAKRKRGRPSRVRKVEGTVDERIRASACVKKDCDVGNDGEEEKDEDTLVDMSTSLSEGEVGGERNGYDDSQYMECDEDADGSDHGDKHMSKLKTKKGRRGRKRKLVDSSVHESENGACKKKAKETSFDGESERVGRVLRSRAVTSPAFERHKKTDVLSKKIIGKTKEESAHFSGRQNKKMEGRRGRPSKVQGKNGPLKMIDTGKLKNCLPSLSEQQKEDSSSDSEANKIVLKRSNSKKHEEGEAEGMSRSVKKKLLKDRITKMLLSAGWTIEYRPRNGRDYADAVYVSPRGRGYWSVTLAYRILEQEVENGKADSRAVSAFVRLPANEYNSLLRKTEPGIKKKSKKPKGVKDQSNKVISRKKISKKKHPKERDRLRLKQKESLRRSKGKEKSNKKRFTLLVRGSKKGGDSNYEDFLLYKGKRSLLSWMVDLGTVPLGVKVKCMNSRRTKVLLEGKVAKDGIHCDCCNKTLALADFEIHSGSSLAQPLQNIYLDSKTSLLQCLRDSWSKYVESMSLGYHSVDVDGDDPNDDTCNMCGDGGNLICCDSCPSAIHQKCLNIQKFPSGDWNCNYCACKFCGLVGKSTCDKDQNCSTSAPALPTCGLCEEKYHPLCVQGKDTSHSEPSSPTFCGQKCQEIFQQLEKLFGVKHQMEEGFSWTLLQHSDDILDIASTSGANKVECNAKLAVAWSIMDECFLPIVDQRSGINMIRNVVYSCGSNIRRLNYTGFFVAILERDDEIISAATLRIHGNLLAEMPFIGTRYTYRRQGMCRRLLNAVETALCSLNVEKLVLPAISEVHQTWTSVFGFRPLEETHKKEMKCMNMIAFPGVDMLQKPVVKSLFGVENLSSATDVKSSETADVAAIGNPTSQVSNVSSNEQSFMTTELVDCQNFVATIEEKDSQKEASSELNDCHASEEINKQEIVPSGSCDVASNGNSRLNEQEVDKLADITVISEAVSDTIKCETETAHLSDVKEIVGCVLNGEVSAINHSRDQNVVKNHGSSTQALVLV